MGVKTAVHESNALWGLANKICARFATLRLMGLPMQKTFKNAVLTSTPIRPEFGQSVSRETALSQLGLKSSLPTVLVMGGSQGAKGLNQALISVIKALPTWQFIHITGKRWYEPQAQAYKGLPNVKVLDYCEGIYLLMKSVDLMICRSGASTLAEVIACKVPAVLVPFPYAAANHQYFNAKVLADSGCAQLIVEGPELAANLQQALRECTPEKLAAMRQAYNNLPVPDPLHATENIAKLLMNL